jgi:hypothetical protein
MISLSILTNQELHSKIKALVIDERRLTVEVLRHLREVERPACFLPSLVTRVSLRMR